MNPNESPDPLVDAWLTSAPQWYAKAMYAGLARARERYALSLLNDKGSDTHGALKHMRTVRHYEQKAAAIRLGPQ